MEAFKRQMSNRVSFFFFGYQDSFPSPRPFPSPFHRTSLITLPLHLLQKSWIIIIEMLTDDPWLLLLSFFFFPLLLSLSFPTGQGQDHRRHVLRRDGWNSDARHAPSLLFLLSDHWSIKPSLIASCPRFMTSAGTRKDGKEHEVPVLVLRCVSCNGILPGCGKRISWISLCYTLRLKFAGSWFWLPILFLTRVGMNQHDLVP